MSIIALTGKKQSGKDVMASYFVKRGFIHYKFADPIKELCSNVFLWDDDWVNGQYKETVDPRWGISPREAQQLIGTELFRQYLPVKSEGFRIKTEKNIWVNRFRYWYQNLFLTDMFPNVVISDLRFLNEAEVVREMGGSIVRIDRPSITINDSHASETEMEEIIPDYTIINNSSIATYEGKIREFVDAYIKITDAL